MSIQVGGVTVIDNSRNIVSGTLPAIAGTITPLATINLAGASTAIFNLSSYGLNATSCSYAYYKIFLDCLVGSGVSTGMNLWNTSGTLVSQSTFYQNISNSGQQGPNAYGLCNLGAAGSGYARTYEFDVFARGSSAGYGQFGVTIKNYNYNLYSVYSGIGYQEMASYYYSSSEAIDRIGFANQYSSTWISGTARLYGVRV